MSMTILAAAMLAAPPAQPAPVRVEVPVLAISDAPASAAPVDPERLALARTAIDYVWPLGTYRRMMSGTMDSMMDALMGSMGGMRVSDLMPPGAAGAEPVDPKAANATLRETMAKADPYFQERMRIMNQVMMSEMEPIMSKFEPDLREGLAQSYARKFTVQQLEDMNRFFATPTGRVYASEAMLTMMDPAVMGAMMKAMPEFMKAMPQIMAKMEQATAHLPKPPAVSTAAPRHDVH